MKKSSILVFFMVLLIPFSIQAFTFRADESINIKNEEVHEGTLFAGGTNISIEKTINGDIICAGQNISINGEVNGDVLCLGQAINIFGKVNGNVRLIGDSINLNSEISRNVNLFANSISLGNENKINGDVFFMSTNADLRGEIEKQVYSFVRNIFIDAKLDSDIEINTADDESSIKISDTAQINGNLTYSAKEKIEIDGKNITGEIIYKEQIVSKKNLALNKAWNSVVSIFSSLAIGLVLISLFRKPIKKTTDQMLSNIGLSISWGGAFLILTPFFVIFLFLTIIGMPLAFILLAFWVIAIYVSKTVTAILIGRVFYKKFIPDKKESLIWAMIIGIVISSILFNVPVLGALLFIAAILWGLGGMVLYFKNKNI